MSRSRCQPLGQHVPNRGGDTQRSSNTLANVHAQTEEGVEGLFPMAMFWPPTPYADKEKETTEGVRISNAEQLVIAKELKITKAHGPNGIPNVAVRTAMCAFPDMIRTLPQKCLDEGCSQTYGRFRSWCCPVQPEGV